MTPDCGIRESEPVGSARGRPPCRDFDGSRFKAEYLFDSRTPLGPPSLRNQGRFERQFPSPALWLTGSLAGRGTDAWSLVQDAASSRRRSDARRLRTSWDPWYCPVIRGTRGLDAVHAGSMQHAVRVAAHPDDETSKGIGVDLTLPVRGGSMIVKQLSCSSVDVLVIDEQHHAFRHSVLKTLKAKKSPPVRAAEDPDGGEV